MSVGWSSVLRDVVAFRRFIFQCKWTECEQDLLGTLQAEVVGSIGR
jgi:hypothetical protein